jgi:IS4 transposase
MKHTNTILHQLLKYLPKQRFQEAVDRHKGDYRSRKLRCWDQLLSMLFLQLSGRVSLRDLVDTFNSQQAHHYHLGTNAIRKSSLADANEKRPQLIFQETFYYLLEQVRDQLPKKDATQMVRLIDSSTIDLNLEQFQWAHFRSTKAGIKLHTVYDPNAKLPVFFALTEAKMNDCKALNKLPMMSGMTYVVDRAYNDYRWYHALDQQDSFFVGRMKSNARYEVVEEKQAKGEGVISDELIRLSAKKAQKDCPIILRRVTYLREEDQKLLVFISNDLSRSASEIAALYKQRWQIELFFKWIKQNLKVKRFVGRSENAVMIQVLIAMIAFLLLRLAQMGTYTAFSLYEMARLISVNLMSRRSISELFNPPPIRSKQMKNDDLQMNLNLCFS